MNAVARFFSVLFHPLLMATYLFALLAVTLPSALSPLQPGSHPTFILLVFIVTFLLPLLCIGIFKTFGTIRNFMMADRKERIIPFVFITGIYVAVTIMFYTRTDSTDVNFLRLLMIVDLLVIVSTAATLFFKISVHSVGIWGLIGITLPLTQISEVNYLFYSSIALIVLAGVVMSARLQLGAHSAREVMWGSIAGLATSVSGMLLFF